jgi:hypothetical protein
MPGSRQTEAKLAKECIGVQATIDKLTANGEPARAMKMLNAMDEEVGGFRVARDLRRTPEELLYGLSSPTRANAAGRFRFAAAARCR